MNGLAILLSIWISVRVSFTIWLPYMPLSTVFLLITKQKYSLHVEYEKAYNVRLQNIIKAAYAQTGREAVVLIDEYDAPMHDSMKNSDLQEQIRNAMRNLFSPLKGEERHLRFVFLTGISKFSQLSIFSELNNITNISMLDKYSDICGISRKELVAILRLTSVNWQQKMK